MRRYVLVLLLGLPLAALGPIAEDASDNSTPQFQSLPLAVPLSGEAAPAVVATGAVGTGVAATGVAATGIGGTGVASPVPGGSEAPQAAVAPDQTAAAASAPAAMASYATPIQSPPSTDLSPSSPFDGNTILAFYGKPGAKSMGILGEYPKEQVASLLLGYARLYADAIAAAAPSTASAGGQSASQVPVVGTQSDPDKPAYVQPPSRGPGVVPAFYIIYGACWPGGDIGYLKDSTVKEWIDYANREGILVFLDHQIGRFGVDDAMKRLLPWLAYPNVHLALDPEWRTDDPMKTIGSITADELNRAQSMMSDWMRTHGIADERILVVHQFAEKMIAGRDKVRADWPGVRLIHTADGFGSPALKRSTYAWNARATNMPRKGFKLFFKTDVPGAGFDDPLLSPAEVLSLKPAPQLVIYQ